MLSCYRVVTSLLFLLAFFFSLLVQAQKQDEPEQIVQLYTKAELQKNEMEKARKDATPIDKRSMSKLEMEHSKLYFRGIKVQSLRERSLTEDVYLVRTTEIEYNGPSQFDFHQEIQNLVNLADAVVIGEVNSKASQLTTGEDFVFTDYQISTVDVIKDNPKAPIRLNPDIIFTRIGGAVLLKGRLIVAIDRFYQPLMKREQYLLFLKYLPSTGSYTSINSKAVIHLGKNGKISMLTREYFPVDKLTNDYVESAARRACDQTKNGE